MKTLGIFALVFAISNFAYANLPAQSVATTRYQSVTVFNVVSAKENVVYEPESATSLASYKGSVEVTVNVEGNICAAEPTSIGTFMTLSGGERLIHVIVGEANASSEFRGCLQYSSEATVTFTLPFFEYVSKGEKVDKSLGVVPFHDSMSGVGGKKDIRINAENGKVKLTLVDI